MNPVIVLQKSVSMFYLIMANSYMYQKSIKNKEKLRNGLSLFTKAFSWIRKCEATKNGSPAKCINKRTKLTFKSLYKSIRKRTLPEREISNKLSPKSALLVNLLRNLLNTRRLFSFWGPLTCSHQTTA